MRKRNEGACVPPSTLKEIFHEFSAGSNAGDERGLDFKAFLRAAEAVSLRIFDDEVFAGHGVQMLKLLRLLLRAPWAAQVQRNMANRGDMIVAKRLVLLKALARGFLDRQKVKMMRDEILKQALDDRIAAYATRVQSAARRILGKKRSADAASMLYLKYHDKGSGNLFYQNPRTGKVSWTKPRLLGKLDARGEAVPIDSRHEFIVRCSTCCNSDTGHVNHTPAKVFCRECNTAYCEPCVRRHHQRGNRLTHSLDLLPMCGSCGFQMASRVCKDCPMSRLHERGQDDSRLFPTRVHACDVCFEHFHKSHCSRQSWVVIPCIECSEFAAKWHCVECDDVYCNSCFGNMHSWGSKQRHQHIAVGFYTPRGRKCWERSEREKEKRHSRQSARPTDVDALVTDQEATG
jgi:hypothetical protein